MSSTEPSPTSLQTASPVAQSLLSLRRRVADDDEIRAVVELPARQARHADHPIALHAELTKLLEQQGTWPLWSHQARAVELARAGRHVVVASSTASGKTLCYNLPVLDAVLTTADAHALYLFPTKALAQNQHRALRGFVDGLGLSVETGIYDGDTEPTLRRRLRRNGRLILTNPDMLHAAILPHHGGWAGLFANLRYVIVDELHSLRGLFGSHVANVLRRLRRVARHHGSDPVFIGASATIRNPAEHAERLFGLPVEVVDEDGAPRGRKTVVLWNPPLFQRDDGTAFRKGAPSVAVRLLPELVNRGVKTICFGKSRNTVEVILRHIRERAAGRNRGAQTAGPAIEAYRGGYLPSERRKIEQRLFSGELGGVVSTNALELGIDVGALDGCLIVGWPGSVCSFWQQAGRAGRRRGDSLVVLIAGQDPIDQYFMRHPEELLQRSPECAVIDHRNPYIQVRHLVCAAYELPLGSADTSLFGDDLLPTLALMSEDGRLVDEDGRWYLAGQEYPAAEVKLRSATDENFTILELGPEKVIGELDYVAAMLSLYEGAVYIHQTETFLVEEMDHPNQLVRIRRAPTGYYTQALCRKQVTVRDEWQRREATGCTAALAAVDVVTYLTGYKKVRFHTIENIGFGRIDLPPLELDTVALLIDLAPQTVTAAAPFGPDFLRAGLAGLARVLQQLLSIRAMCEPSDLDTHLDSQRIYLYDLYPGGIGYSEIGFEHLDELLQETLEAIIDCPCEVGCPGCVLPGAGRTEDADVIEYPYPKEATRFLLHRLLGRPDYVPQLTGVALAPPTAPMRPARELSAITERKVRKVLGQLRSEA